MKKRVLSMLLLLAMVVTALPLVALPVVAAEGTDEKLFTEEEYNALYVEGAYYAFDFYKTNDHWDPNGEASVTMTAPEIGTVRNTLNGYVWAGSAYFHYTGTGADTAFNSTSDGTNNLTIDNGYLDTTPFNYISLQLTESNQANGAGSTIQQVRAYNEASSGSYGLSFCDIRVLVSGKVVTYLSKGKGSAPAANNSFLAPNKAVADMTTPYSYTLAYKIDQTTGQGPMAFYQGASEIFKYSAEIEESTDVTYGFTANTKVEHYTFWSIGDDRLYGARYYNKVLTDTEVAQNHFADIMKWFRLDLSAVKLLLEKGEDLSALYTEAAKYTFDSKKTDVVTGMQKAANTLVAELYKTDENKDAIDAAVEHGLEFTTLITYPAVLLPKTYMFLLGLDTYEGTDMAADYQAAKDADLLPYIGISTMTEEQYNALYVEGAYYAFDFYETNDHWDPNGEASVVAVEPDLTKADTNPLNAFVWAGSANFHDKRVGGDTAFKSEGTKTVTIDNGYLDTNPFDYLSLYLTESNLANGAGSTIQQVRAYNQASSNTYGLSFADIRFHISGKTVQYLAFCNGDKGTAASASNSFLSPNKTVADMTTPYSYTFAHKIDETTGKGPAAFYQGATEIFKYSAEIEGSEDVDYGKTANTIRENYLYWGGGYDKLYGARYYNKVLTDTEVKQNHFADLAKWFRLSLEGFDSLSDAGKKNVYDTIAKKGFTFDSKRIDVQNAVVLAILEERAAVYDGFRGVNPQINDAFIDLAADYLLDINDLIATGRTMSHVTDTVTASALLGKTTIEAQKILDEAYYDAWNYHSYKTGGTTDKEKDWDAFLTTCAGAYKLEDYENSTHLDLEALMALPKSERLGVLVGLPTEAAEIPEHVEAFMADKGEAYYPAMTEEDYNALYVQGYWLAMDFYRTNGYWNPTGENISLNLQDYDLTKGTRLEGMTVGADYLKDGYLNTAYFGGSGTPIPGTNSGIFANDNTTYALTEEYVGSYKTPAGHALFVVNGLWIASAVSDSDLTLTVKGWKNPSAEGPSMTDDGATIALSVPGGVGKVNNYAFSLKAEGIADTTAVNYSNDTATLPGEFDFYVNGDPSYTTDRATFTKKQGFYTDNNATSYFKHWSGDQEVYAYRHYRRQLTPTELAQNHFADLAKWYRLNVSLLPYLSEAQTKQLYEDMAAYSVGGTTAAERAAVQDAVNAAFSVLYTDIKFYDDADKNDAFLAVAIDCGLDLSPVRMLAQESRTAVAEAILAEFDTSGAYAFNPDVVRYYYNELTENYSVMTFAGYQVRIDTASAAHNYAGVRAVFDLDEAVIAGLLAGGKTVSLRISIKQGAAEVAYITVNATVETVGEGEEAVDTVVYAAAITDAKGTREAVVYDRTREDGSTTKAINYMVTYKGESATAERYAEEYAFAYTIAVGDKTTDFVINSYTFGESVSAFKLYNYFATLDEYKDDVVVKDVLAKVAAAQ